jgi:hypothetical protein
VQRDIQIICVETNTNKTTTGLSLSFSGEELHALVLKGPQSSAFVAVLCNCRCLLYEGIYTGSIIGPWLENEDGLSGGPLSRN